MLIHLLQLVSFVGYLFVPEGSATPQAQVRQLENAFPGTRLVSITLADAVGCFDPADMLRYIESVRFGDALTRSALLRGPCRRLGRQPYVLLGQGNGLSALAERAPGIPGGYQVLYTMSWMVEEQ